MESLNSKKVRRLTDIKVNHVSLVDRAANMCEFILIKQKKGELNMDEVLDILKKLTKGFNDAVEEIESIGKRLEVIEKKEDAPLIAFDVDKAGAKINKSTLEQLKGLVSSLQKIIDGAEGTPDSTEKSVDTEKAFEALSKGMQFALKPEEKKDEKTDMEAFTKAISGVVATAVAEALKK